MFYQMIVRKKRNSDVSETVYLEDTSYLVSTSTNIPMLSNMTSMQLTINTLVNSSITYISEKSGLYNGSFTNKSLASYPDQLKFKMSPSTQEIQQDTKVDGFAINESIIITDDTGLSGSEGLTENLIWGIDNTVNLEIVI